MEFLKPLLQAQKEMRSSDLHLYVGFPPYLRGPEGELYPVKDYKIITKEDTDRITQTLLTQTQFESLYTNKDFEFSSRMENVARFRINFFFDTKGISIVLRIINEDIESLDKLGIPEVIKPLAQEQKGLILISGPNGSGKSTTLSAIINEINETRNCNIITIEDPIEYLHEPKKSIISQREVGVHVKSFKSTAKYLFRQDVNVVVIGEMRDPESFALALDIAETGHLVITTVHAEGVSAAITRIVGGFETHKQNLIRMKLALSLRAIISQMLIPLHDRTGRVPATEILLQNDAVRNSIITGTENNFNQIIEINRKMGMRTFDDSLAELYQQGKITGEQAAAHSKEQEELMNRLSRIKS